MYTDEEILLATLDNLHTAVTGLNQVLHNPNLTIMKMVYKRNTGD